MDKNVFITVAAPTLVSAGGAPFIAITTKGYSDNFTEKLFNKKKADGTPLINHIEIELICQKCKRAKKMFDDDVCNHYQGSLPWWHSKKRHKEVEMILSDYKDEYLREVRGIQSEKDVFPVFNHAKVNLLLHPSSIYKSTYHPKNIITVIDPACGGSQSKHAVSSFMYIDGLMVCLALDTTETSDVEQKSQFIINHIESIKKISLFSHSRFVIIPESNLGSEGQWFQFYTKGKLDHIDHIFMYEDTEGRVGIRTTANLKKQMAIAFSNILNQNKFKFHGYFQTITANMTPQLMKEEIVKQAKDYSIKIERSNNKFAIPTEIYTGKSGYGWDDMLMTVQINYIAWLRFISDKINYGKYQ